MLCRIRPFLHQTRKLLRRRENHTVIKNGDFIAISVTAWRCAAPISNEERLISDYPEKTADISRRHHWFPAKWRLRNERRNSILRTRYYPDLGRASDRLKQISNVARPITSTTAQIWVVTRHQYGISALVSQTSFPGDLKAVLASWNVGCFLRLISYRFFMCQTLVQCEQA